MAIATAVRAAHFAGCIQTEAVNPVDNTTEFKFYCQEVGIVREENTEGAFDLIRFESGLSALTSTGT